MWRSPFAVAALAILAAPAFTQPQFAELGKRHLPTDHDPTQALALADVDGDGDLDLVAGNRDLQNRLYLNDGATFVDATAARLPADSDWTESVVLGDVDGDGDFDLICGNYGQQNRLLLNDGTGTFADATAGRMPTDGDSTKSAVLGDVDADGDLDLVLGNDGQDRLYLNDGTGAFTDATATHMPTGGSTQGVVLGDVDLDGDLDLAFGAWGQNRLYLNDGDGRFTDATAAHMPIDSDHTRTVGMGDADGDGSLDLVFGNMNEQNRLYLNDGDGRFTDVTAARLPIDGDYTRAVAFADVDGDQNLDLVVGNYGPQNRLYLNDGTGAFTDATAARMPVDLDQTYAIAPGDMDGDGAPDLVFGNTGQQNRLYLNDGTGLFLDATADRLPPDRDRSVAVALGDVDGDGDRDLIIGNFGQQNRVYRNDGTGAFADVTAACMPIDSHATVAVALGDVDGDGDADLVFGNTERNRPEQNRLYLNDGSGTFADATAAQLPIDYDKTRALVLGDVDGDGDLDLLSGNDEQQNRFYLNDGSGVFADVTAARMPLDGDVTLALALGDVDGDGDPDLILGNYRQQNRLYLNDGAGTFTDGTASLMPTDGDFTRAVALEDVDGDGDPDLVFGNYRQQNRLYLNDGTGMFTDATASRMPTDGDITRAVVLGDMDGDGDLDLVLGNYGLFSNDGQNRLYLNDGTGTFTDASAARMPTDDDTTSAVAFGDVDGDADPDLIFGSDRDQNRLYVNLHRQLDAPFTARLDKPYRLDFYAEPGYGTAPYVALPMLNVALASPPIQIPPLGTLYLEPLGAVALPWVSMAPPVGIGRLPIRVPGNPSIAGYDVCVQTLVLDITSQGAARFSNYTVDVIGR